MWPFDRLSARRTEIRRTKAERVGTWYTWVTEAFEPGWIAVMGMTATAVCLILAAGGPQLSLRAGQSLGRAITARLDFEIADEQQTRDMRVRARDSSPNIYVLDESLVKDIRGRLTTALSAAKANREDAGLLREELAKNKVMLSDDAAIAELQRLARLDDAPEYSRAIEAALSTLRTRAVVESEQSSMRRTATTAILIDESATARERTIRLSQLTYVSDREAMDRLLEEAVRDFPAPLRSSMRGSLLAMLATGKENELKPLYRYDGTRTTEAGNREFSRVPIQFRKYGVSETLADAGLLTEDEIKILQVEHTRWVEQRLAQNPWVVLPETVGRSVLACLVVFGVLLYVAWFQEKERSNPVRRAVTAVVMLVILGLARWGFVQTEAPPHFAVGAQALAAAMLALVYRPGIVFALSAGLAILMTMTVQQGMGFFVVLMVVSGTFVFALREVRNRGKIVLVGIAAGLLGGATTLCLGLVDGEAVRYACLEAMWAGGAIVLAAFIVEGVLPGIERIFHLSTGMTLLEWCDANKPLLRMMAAEAPGTYNHSLLVGALAEAAAEAIDANGLLARAGAYYHDIGKINKPEYFVENLSAGETSRHERLTPQMSALIIINHVKDGIEMAREYGLPESLHAFIVEHHGTTLVEYFYHAANRQRKPDDREVEDTTYRYPGPKPQSRETAIVMMADGVEGAVRSMSEPTPGRIEDVVREIVRKRLIDGQLDECDLTFRDIADIEASLIKTLCGIYHARIAYPEAEEGESADQKSAVRHLRGAS